MSSWTGVGMMSGSSLDGVDLCCVEFTGDYQTDTWGYRILKAITVQYTPEWTHKLQTADKATGEELVRLHAEYGKYMGSLAQEFIDENDFDVKYVASHGHTIFHQPQNSFTFQLGDGETMVAKLKHPLVTNFRNKDIALGGHGAPLVPVGETYLFSQYDVCINLGGIANVSVHDKGFDISVCNMLLNYLSTRYDSSLSYDKDGDIARSGEIIENLLDKLDSLSYYSQTPPKTLGKEWFDSNILPIFEEENSKPQDLLRTAVEHISNQIVASLRTEIENSKHPGGSTSLLVTGGGALNGFLVERMNDKIKAADLNVIVTECDEDTTNFKEALIFAFLGLRCLLGLPNISCSVTGSTTDCVSGSIHLPPTNNPLSNQSAKDYRFHFRAAVKQGYVPPLKKRTEQHMHK